jgi:hypothetical protein
VGRNKTLMKMHHRRKMRRVRAKIRAAKAAAAK